MMLLFFSIVNNSSQYLKSNISEYSVLSPLTNEISDVNSNHGRRLQKRGGGGGFGYQKSKSVHKAKIFKHISKKSDSRQFSR